MIMAVLEAGISSSYAGDLSSPLLSSAGKPEHLFLSPHYSEGFQDRHFLRPGLNGRPEAGKVELSPPPAEKYSPCPDWAGIRWDSYHIFVYQTLSLVIIYFSPESSTNWSHDQKKYSIDKWFDHLTTVVWDKDKWFINYLQHPYWGAGYYVRAKERGFGVLGSFSYSVFMSLVYEFIIEAQFENPSFQDLIVTPVLGSLVGAVFMEVRQRIESKRNARFYHRVILALTDPFGAMNSLVDRALGIGPKKKVECSVLLPLKSARSGSASGRKNTSPFFNGVTGLTVRFTW